MLQAEATHSGTPNLGHQSPHGSSLGCAGIQGTPRSLIPPLIIPPNARWAGCAHLASVCFPAPVDLAKAPTTDDSMHTEVIHGQLQGWQQLGSLKTTRIPYTHAWPHISPLGSSLGHG